jgi:hypothetical protein
MPTGASPRAGSTGTCTRPLFHTAASVTYYAGHLASQTPAWLPMILDVTTDATNAQVLRLLPAAARMLAIVATASPTSARAYHEGGMADASGFVAMAIDEVIVHLADAANGLGLSYDPPEQLARKVVDRLFPWADRHRRVDGIAVGQRARHAARAVGGPPKLGLAVRAARRVGRHRTRVQTAARLLRLGRPRARLARRPLTTRTTALQPARARRRRCSRGAGRPRHDPACFGELRGPVDVHRDRRDVAVARGEPPYRHKRIRLLLGRNNRFEPTLEW